MIKSNHAIQQWDYWLTQPLGIHVLEAERQYLPSLFTNCYGKHALLIGVPKQAQMLKFSTFPHQILLSPLINKNNNIRYIESDFYELPIAAACIDLVLLPHAFEFVDNPQHLLSEACRIVKPEGFIIIFGFNPYSLWGIKKKFMRQSYVPWSGNFISARTIKKWLKLSDFELIKQKTLLFRPPLQHHDILFQKLHMMEWLGSKFWTPFGGIYMLMAKAKVIPLTPIKLHWTQQLTGAQITLPGPSMRTQ